MEIRKEDVGKRVWSFFAGWGTITEVTNSSEKDVDRWRPQPVKVRFDSMDDGLDPDHWFYRDGKVSAHNINPLLFWDEIKFQEPPAPKRKKKVKLERWVNIYEKGVELEVGNYAFESAQEATSSFALLEKFAHVHMTGEYEIDE